MGYDSQTTMFHSGDHVPASVEIKAGSVLNEMLTWSRRVKSCDYLILYKCGDYHYAVVVAASSSWSAVEVLRRERCASVHLVIDVIEVAEHPRRSAMVMQILGTADLRVLQADNKLLDILSGHGSLPVVHQGTKDWFTVKQFNDALIRRVLCR